MGLITRIADKTGALGSIVSAMGCAACFPALASFGAAIELGFLPLFAVLAFMANTLGWLNHRHGIEACLAWSGQPSCSRRRSGFWVIGGRRTCSMSACLHGRGVDLGFRLASASPLRAGRL